MFGLYRRKGALKTRRTLSRSIVKEQEKTSAAVRFFLRPPAEPIPRLPSMNRSHQVLRPSSESVPRSRFSYRHLNALHRDQQGAGLNRHAMHPSRAAHVVRQQVDPVVSTKLYESPCLPFSNKHAR